jgi:hypothetical protein
LDEIYTPSRDTALLRRVDAARAVRKGMGVTTGIVDPTRREYDQVMAKQLFSFLRSRLSRCVITLFPRPVFPKRESNDFNKLGENSRYFSVILTGARA